MAILFAVAFMLQCTGSISTSCTVLSSHNRLFNRSYNVLAVFLPVVPKHPLNKIRVPRCYNVLAVFLPVVPHFTIIGARIVYVTMYWQYFYQLYLILDAFGYILNTVTMYWQYFYQLYLAPQQSQLIALLLQCTGSISTSCTFMFPANA